MEARRAGDSNKPPRARESDLPKIEIRRAGMSAAPGIVVGPAYVMHSQSLSVPQTPVPTSGVDREVKAFKDALEKTRQELTEIKSTLARQMGDDHARIFDAHLLILDDVMVVDDTEALIRSENRNAAWAFHETVGNVLTSFKDIEDEYLKERYVDIVDVKRRVIAKLLGRESRKGGGPKKRSIVIAHELSPSETAQFDRKSVIAYATDSGGRTSHTAILARSQGVAAVVGLEDLSSRIQTGDQVIVDGNTGRVIVNPTKDTLNYYKQEIEQYKKLEKRLLKFTDYPAETLDHRKFQLAANIDMPREVESANSYGAQGVGLFRTEYFFIAQEQLPSEEEQYRVYRRVVEKSVGKPVTIRVLDIGGDKIADYLHGSPELNPFMGWRGIRFLLTRKDIFKTQLRAIFRASAHGNVKILLPLVVSLDEVTHARKICGEVRRELKRGRFRAADNIDLGVMIETPSAVALADSLAKEVDFFSIGTNDLIQYTMAVDRGNSKIAHLYQHLHPAIIRFLKMTVDAGHKQGIPVSVCGEMAVDPLSTIVLIGLGVDELSCSPNMMPEVKRIIRSVTFDECKTLVRRLLKHATTEEIERDVRKVLKERCPDLPIFGEVNP